MAASRAIASCHRPRSVSAPAQWFQIQTSLVLTWSSIHPRRYSRLPARRAACSSSLCRRRSRSRAFSPSTSRPWAPSVIVIRSTSAASAESTTAWPWARPSAANRPATRRAATGPRWKRTAWVPGGSSPRRASQSEDIRNPSGGSVFVGSPLILILEGGQTPPAEGPSPLARRDRRDPSPDALDPAEDGLVDRPAVEEDVHRGLEVRGLDPRLPGRGDERVPRRPRPRVVQGRDKPEDRLLRGRGRTGRRHLLGACAVFRKQIAETLREHGGVPPEVHLAVLPHRQLEAPRPPGP